MKIILDFIFLLSLNSCNSQNYKTKQLENYLIIIANNHKLEYLKYDKEFGLLKIPIIIFNKNCNRIIGYDKNRGGGLVSISPNHSYIILDYISMGYIYE